MIVGYKLPDKMLINFEYNLSKIVFVYSNQKL